MRRTLGLCLRCPNAAAPGRHHCELCLAWDRARVAALRSPERRRRRCSVCGGAGHNAATCPTAGRPLACDAAASPAAPTIRHGGRT